LTHFQKAADAGLGCTVLLSQVLGVVEMEITVSAIWFPVIATVFCLGMLIRPYQQSGDYDMGSIFRLFWLIPVGFIWAAYFAIGWAVG
jgi:hypothetical protein